MGGARTVRHPELSLVSLSRPVETEGGLLPAGAAGTVVHVYRDERAYEVEFLHPFHTVVTLQADAIEDERRSNPQHARGHRAGGTLGL